MVIKIIKLIAVRCLSRVFTLLFFFKLSVNYGIRNKSSTMGAYGCFFLYLFNVCKHYRVRLFFFQVFSHCLRMIRFIRSFHSVFHFIFSSLFSFFFTLSQDEFCARHNCKSKTEKNWFVFKTRSSLYFINCKLGVQIKKQTKTKKKNRRRL